MPPFPRQPPGLRSEWRRQRLLGGLRNPPDGPVLGFITVNSIRASGGWVQLGGDTGRNGRFHQVPQLHIEAKRGGSAARAGDAKGLWRPWECPGKQPIFDEGEVPATLRWGPKRPADCRRSDSGHLEQPFGGSEVSGRCRRHCDDAPAGSLYSLANTGGSLGERPGRGR